MRRRVTMVVSAAGIALPLLTSGLFGSVASAHGPVLGAPKSAAAAASASSAPASSAAAPASSGSAATAASAAPSAVPAPGAAPSNPAQVNVDMTSNNTPTGGAMNGATYAVRLRDLEQRVDELKDQIRRSHTRLALLSDTIIGGGAAGSRAEVQFDNEMSSAFQLTRALFVIDGQVQYNRQDDSGALSDQKEIPIYTGTLPPGDHTIQVALTFQGNGYGVFSYLRGYKFEVKSSHAFTATEGKQLTVTATAYEKGGVTTQLEQRPTVEWHEKVQPLTSQSVAASPPTPAPAAPAAPAAGPGANGSVNLSIGGGKK